MSTEIKPLSAAYRPTPAFIWAYSSNEKACEMFDELNYQIKDVRDSAGDEAADYYHTWILKRLL